MCYVVRGLDQAILGYEDTKRALGWETHDLHQYDPRDIPAILSHLNQVRECWRDNLRSAVVFIIPPFVIRYLILRCPDFYDWRLGTFILPKNEEMYQEQLNNWMRISSLNEYMELPKALRLEKIRELRDSLEDDNLTDIQKAKLAQKQGWLFQINNDYSLALSCYNKSIKFNSLLTQKYGKIMLLTCIFLERWEEAVASLDKSLGYQPDNSLAWFGRGVCLGWMKRRKEALASYDKALEYKPDNYHAWYERGVCLGWMKRRKEALASYDKALEYEPDNYHAWCERGLCLMKLGRRKEALASYDKALEYEPEYYRAWFGRGVCLMKPRRRREALASYDKALEYQPEYSQAWCWRGVCLMKLRRRKEALASYDKALEYQPEYSQAWCWRGVCLMKLRRQKEALASYNKALEYQPEDYRAWFERGKCLRALERSEEAIASFQKALNNKPNIYFACLIRIILLFTRK